MKEKRRLKIATRQYVLAQVARREAMAALADAVRDEAKSAALEHRSREILSVYSRSEAASSGFQLREHNAFVGRLHEVADQAGQARKDARDQAQWQMQTLAAAETRAARLGERKDAAQKLVEAAQDKRDAPVPIGMARKLQLKLRNTGKS